MKVTQDEEVRLRADPPFQAPVDQPVQSPRGRKAAGDEKLQNLYQGDRQSRERPDHRKNELPRKGLRVEHQRCLGIWIHGQAVVQIEREPWVWVATTGWQGFGPCAELMDGSRVRQHDWGFLFG